MVYDFVGDDRELVFEFENARTKARIVADLTSQHADLILLFNINSQ